MSQDIFLKLTGITGESQDASHKDEIEVLDWEWEITQQSTMHAGSGGGAGKATVSDLIFDHYVDRASPNLLKYCLTGKHIDTATLVVRKAGGTPLEYLTITMDDVIATRVARNRRRRQKDQPHRSIRDVRTGKRAPKRFPEVARQGTRRNARRRND